MHDPAFTEYRKMVAAIGPGYHPDTPGDDYDSLPTGYTAAGVDRITREVLVTPADPYDIALEVLGAVYPGTVALRPLPVTSTVRIYGECHATFDGRGTEGRIVSLTFSPSASNAGYFGPAAEVIEGDTALDVDSTDGPFWRAVQTTLARGPVMEWTE